MILCLINPSQHDKIKYQVIRRVMEWHDTHTVLFSLQKYTKKERRQNVYNC